MKTNLMNMRHFYMENQILIIKKYTWLARNDELEISKCLS